MCRHRRPSTRNLLTNIQQSLHDLHRKVNTMATQDQVDALAAAIDTHVANIRQDIADIKAAHPDVDFSPLQRSVEGLANLDAENPTPPAEPQE